MTKLDTSDLRLLRHHLGSIDLSDLEEKEMSEGERKEYCAAISAVWPRLEKDIKKFLYRQLLFISNEAETWERVIFGRGTYNGIALLEEHWRQADAEHRGEVKEKSPKKFDEHAPIGSVEE